MKPENIMLNEKRTDTKSYILYDSIYIKPPEQASLQRYEVEQCLRGDGGREEWTMTINKYRISV